MEAGTIVESFRDLAATVGAPAVLITRAANAFDWQLGELPKGYDHRYLSSHLGYNLKPLDIQAAIGSNTN